VQILKLFNSGISFIRENELLLDIKDFFSFLLEDRL